jgi:hypothetical protein
MRMYLPKILGTLFSFCCALFANASTPTGNPFKINRTDCLLISDGKVLESGKIPREKATIQEHLRIAISGHEIGRGKSLIFAFRNFEDSGKGVDSAEFAKGTFTLSDASFEIPNQQSATLAVDSASFTQGGVGFIGRGEYWQARNPGINIEINRIGQEIKAAVKGEFLVWNGANSKTFVLNSSCTVKLLKAHALNAWEGKPGAAWRAFSPQLK